MKIKGKGTTLALTFCGVSLTPAQLLSVEHSGAQTETFEADTLDNTLSGIPHLPSGRTEPGSLSAEMFFDPALHATILQMLTSNGPYVGTATITLPNTSSMAWAMAGIGLDAPRVALNDGVKGCMSIKLSGNVTSGAGNSSSSGV